MQREKYLVKNTALFALGNIGTKLISFFLVPLYTNALSTSEYGIIDLIATICTVLIPVLTFNIGESVMRFSLDEEADYDRIMSIGFVFMAISIAVGGLVLPASKMFDSTSGLGLYIYSYCITLGISQICICNLRGREKILEYAISNILQTLFIAVFNILFLVGLKEGIQGYFKAYILANILVIIYSSYVGKVIDSIRHFVFDKSLIWKMASYSIALIPTSLMWWITHSSDRLMVTSMIGSDANGIYAISYKVPTLLSTLSIIFNQAWSYSAIKEDTSADIEEYHNTMYNQLVKTLLLLTAGMLLVIKPFLKLYVAQDYYIAWKYTPFLLIGFVFMTLATFLATPYSVHKDSIGFLLSSAVGAVVNIMLNLILIPNLGLTGAAVATCLSYFSVYVFRSIHSRKYVKIKIINMKHIIGCGMLITMGLTLFLNGTLGYVLLIIEFIVVVYLLRDFLFTLIRLAHIILKKVIKPK